MIAFRLVTVVALGLTCAGCLTDLTLKNKPFFAPRRRPMKLWASHKISWVEAARRDEAQLTRITGDKLNQSERLLLADRASLAAEVDAGNMTPEMAKFRYEEKNPKSPMLRRRGWQPPLKL